MVFRFCSTLNPFAKASLLFVLLFGSIERSFAQDPGLGTTQEDSSAEKQIEIVQPKLSRGLFISAGVLDAGWRFRDGEKRWNSGKGGQQIKLGYRDGFTAFYGGYGWTKVNYYRTQSRELEFFDLGVNHTFGEVVPLLRPYFDFSIGLLLTNKLIETDSEAADIMGNLSLGAVFMPIKWLGAFAEATISGGIEDEDADETEEPARYRLEAYRLSFGLRIHL